MAPSGQTDTQTVLTDAGLDAAELRDVTLFERLHPAIQRWWVSQFAEAADRSGGLFTAPQRAAIPAIADGQHVLVCAPTGAGKTLAAFTSILDELTRTAAAGELTDGVRCVYVSPLRSLANDIDRNLQRPLDAIAAWADADDADVEIRQAIRHGDTDTAERRAMVDQPPHILNTTPESLAILLNAPRFREHLRSVRYVIVDEIHAVADNKRGTHLSVSLERLSALADVDPLRIGCSATVEPIDRIGAFLGGVGPAGEPRAVEVVDARFTRSFDLELVTPVADLVTTPRTQIQEAVYARLHSLIEAHTNTLVFTNTRSGAERILAGLRERFPDSYTEATSGCHHGSLARPQREAVEAGLKAGTLRVVTTSTSLELGIDMPHIDLVVQIGSPKSVAALLQRVGRAGHHIGAEVVGRVLVTDRDELIECAVMLQAGLDGEVDAIEIPAGGFDVATQHVYGMAIAAVRPVAEARAILRRAYPYRHFTAADWETLERYLRAAYEGLDERHVYPKIWCDANGPPSDDRHRPAFAEGERLMGKRGRLARMIYMTNIGTIPDSFSCQVHLRGDDSWVGSLDEGYLDTMDPGDVFQLGGGRYAYRYRRGSKVYVDPSSARPTIPSWYSERLPLSADTADAVAAFTTALTDEFDRGGVAAAREWLRSYPIDEDAVRAIAGMVDLQRRFIGADATATTHRILIEEETDETAYRRRFYVHAPFGRRVNDGLSRMVAHHCADRYDTNVSVAVADLGFTVGMPLNRHVELASVLRSLATADVRAELVAALEGTDLLAKYFRINAARSLMILRRYKGTERSAAQQQVSAEMLLSFAASLEDFAVIEETYREVLDDRLATPRTAAILESIATGERSVVHHRVPSPSPMAFGLATLSSSDVVLAEDRAAVLAEFHARVVAAVEADQ
ncbi:MAG: ATP-dependent helicase [Haloferacaceae archaeon]|jgi:ATP-dependent Lhr-like helicase|nr:ATP-dependent helicase [Haloferacaceae archaeon]